MFVQSPASSGIVYHYEFKCNLIFLDLHQKEAEFKLDLIS